jgi:hypothetical protein
MDASAGTIGAADRLACEDARHHEAAEERAERRAQRHADADRTVGGAELAGG